MSKRAGALTPEQFVEKWAKVQLNERKASQEHFLDLCHLLDQPTPAEADATGEDYCFEKHVKVVGSASRGSRQRCSVSPISTCLGLSAAIANVTNAYRTLHDSIAAD